MGKKLLDRNQLEYVGLSSIDIAANNYLTTLVYKNKCLQSPTDLFVHKAARYCFPATDDDISRYSATRSPPEIIKNIIQVLANKLKPTEYDLWCKLCERDVATPEFYESGLAMLSSDLKKLSKQFKIQNAKFPSSTDMSPVKKANIALTIPDGHWTLGQLIAALQHHLAQGHKLYQFLNKDNSVALICELLVICTEPRVIKLLHRYDRILKQGDCLTIKARRKLAAVIRNHIPLTFDKQLRKNRAIQINLTEAASRLPFVEAIFTHTTPLPNQLETFPINRALCDTGSDCSLIPYK